MTKIIPIIVAGGVGSRLWPVSTPDIPKQFIPLKSGGTTFENTLQRVSNRHVFDRPIVVCSFAHIDLVSELGRGDCPDIICEPIGRNTAAAFCVGMLAAWDLRDRDAVVIILPADHFIPDVVAFENAVMRGVAMAKAGQIVTFGVEPQFAHTQYGYIEKGDVSGQGFRVKSFTEKPDVDTAQSYLDCGRYLWNSGIFMGRVAEILGEVQCHRPDVLQAVETSWVGAARGDGVYHLLAEMFIQVPKISFDYAVMEHTDRAMCVAG